MAHRNALLLVPVLVCTAIAPALAQATFGTITGSVRDVSGAVVPGVTVEAINQATNLTRAVVSDDRGNYAVTHLNAGVYTVSAELAGFKGVTFRDIRLDTLGTVRVDIRLEPGGLVDEVVVRTVAPVVESDVSMLADVKDNRLLTDLPMNIRGAGAAYQWTWITPTGTQGTGSSRAFAGGRSTMNNFNVDGVSGNSPAFGNELAPVQPMRESIQEVRFEYANSRAEFGTMANVTAISRSGGNEFHGAGFWNTYPGELAARDFFAREKGRVPREHVFGGSLGGPITRDRAFFFAAYEGYRKRQQNVLAPNVPTAKMRQGDFSELLNLPTPIAIVDPRTGQRFDNNVIPADRLYAGAVAWQNRFYPLPNFGPPELLVGNYRDVVPTEGRLDQFNTRIDYQFSPRSLLYGRFSYSSLDEQFLNSGLPSDITGFNDNVHKGFQGTVSHTWMISSSVINEAKFGFTRRTIDWGGHLDAQEALDLAGIGGLPDVQGIRDLPRITITGFQGIGGSGVDDDNESSLQWIDQLSFMKGRHLWKTGVEFKPAGAFARVFQDLGQYQFTNAFTGYAYADFLLGLPQTTIRSLQRPEVHQRFSTLSLFVQDDFKVSSGLTLNYGLRWEFNRPAYATNDLIANFDPSSGALVVPDEDARGAVHARFPATIPIRTAAEADYPARSLREHDLNNVAPRLGFAWRPFGHTRTALRGGYGVFFDELTISVSSPLFGTGPYGLTERFVNRVAAGRPDLTLERPFLEAGTLGAIQVSGVSRDLINPYVQQWNLTLEQDVGFQTSVRLSYIGTKGTQLIYQRNVNQPLASPEPFSRPRLPYQSFDQIVIRENGGTSLYNALSAEVQRKLQRGVYFQAAWTWAKHLTDAADTGGEGGATIENAYDRRRQRGNAQFTPRHRLVSSVIWELPVGTGRRYLDRAGWLDHLLGGWQLSAVYIAQTGLYLTPSFSGPDPSNTQTFGGVPDRVGDGNLPSGERHIDRWFDPSAFVVPPNGRFGNAGFGILESPGRQVVNLGLFKGFRIAEGELRLEITATNALNHPNFGNPSLNISAPGTVATIRSTYTASDFSRPREFMIGLRYQF